MGEYCSQTLCFHLYLYQDIVVVHAQEKISQHLTPNMHIIITILDTNAPQNHTIALQIFLASLSFILSSSASTISIH
jgi:hypothetical protein